MSLRGAADVREWSIASLVVCLLLAGITALLGAAGAAYYVSDRQQQWLHLESDLSRTTEQLATSLALAVWNIDREQIDEVAKSMMQDRNVFAIVVQAAGRTQTQTRDQDWKATRGTAVFARSGLLVEERGIVFSGEVIGSVQAFFTPRFVEESLRRSRQTIVSMILLLDMVLVILLYGLLWRTVLRPLKRVERYASDVSAGRDAGTIGPGRLFQGELESLRKSITSMVGELDRRYAESRALSDHLRLELDEKRKSEEARLHLQAQLAQAQKLESLGRIAGGLAHDFNNILLVVLGYAELMLNQLPASFAQRKELMEIIAGAERASALTRKLLAIGRNQPLDVRSLDLNEVIRHALKLIRRIVPEDVQIQTFLCSEVAHIAADRSQLEQLLMNLCINARDAMPGGGILKIQTSLSSETGDLAQLGAPTHSSSCVVLQVADTGVGMDESTQFKAFDPFFTTKASGKGTGLGLATVHGVMKQHGGDIQVESEPGHGTSFRLLFPRAPGAVTEAISETAPEPSPGSGETILVVEDDAAVREVIACSLRHLGYEVIVARGAGEAFRLARSRKSIDLLLTDVVMPRMNGRQLSIAIRKTHPGIAVLFMSGYTQNIFSRGEIDEKRVAFLPKPFGETALSQKVREALQAG